MHVANIAPRPMLVIREVSWASRAARSPSRRTTNPSWKVKSNLAVPVQCPGLCTDSVGTLVEKNRITAAGGFVDFGRVNGNLALSRAIGDFEFKKSAELSPENQIVTAFPDVDEHEITEEDEFLVLACDGELERMAGARIASEQPRLTFTA